MSEHLHERKYRLKREAASEMYTALKAIESRRQSGHRTDTDYVFSLVDSALAKARGEA